MPYVICLFVHLINGKQILNTVHAYKNSAVISERAVSCGLRSIDVWVEQISWQIHV